MLTSLYYYDYYKPYIFSNNKNRNESSIFNRKPKKAYEEDISGEHGVLLNKALKKNVVNYAQDIYKSVVGVKSSSKDILNQIGHVRRQLESFYSSYQVYQLDDAVEDLYEHLDEYVSSYNTSQIFHDQSNQSEKYARFYRSLFNAAEELHTVLDNFGVRKDPQGFLYIDDVRKTEVLESTKIEVLNLMNESVALFQHSYDEACELMNEPMSTHMNFKGLNYYYSYQFNRIESNTFRIIEEGMLLDVSL